MPKERYDVIVIGSGPGGLSCAALLQKRGIRTLLIEKNGFCGGKMVSIEKDGYAYDLFPHGQVPVNQPAFQGIFNELGVGDEFQPALRPDDPREMIKMVYRRRDWKHFKMVSTRQAMTDSNPLFQLWEIDEEAQQKALAFMTDVVMMPEDTLGELDNVSMHEFMSRYDIPCPASTILAGGRKTGWSLSQQDPQGAVTTLWPARWTLASDRGSPSACRWEESRGMLLDSPAQPSHRLVLYV